jgi:peptidoglycan/LPS O-acetylase OafA/YrhL
MKSQRIEWLDLLRGLAAMAVVAYHFHAFVGLGHTGYAFVAVDVFFALSGVVLSLKYANAIENGMGPLEFAGVRLRRLYPMVLIVGLFIVALNAAGVAPGALVVASDTDAVNVLFVLPLPGAPALTAFPADPPMWSFWAELAVNALWFCVLKMGRRWMLPIGVASMAALVAIALRMNTLNVGWEDGAAFRLASVVRAMAWFSVGYWIVQRTATLRTAAVIFTASLCALVLIGRVGQNHAGLNELLGASTGVALLNLAYCLPSPGAALGAVSRLLGMVSFPLYLVHSPAGRLLPYFDRLPHWAALLLVIGGATMAATVLNEALVKLVARAHRARNPVSTPATGH